MIPMIDIAKVTAPSLLMTLYFWDYRDRKETARYASQYKPFAIKTDDATFTPNDVSVVVPTIDWDESTLPANIKTWMKNKVREIIFVTVRRDAEKLREFLRTTPCLGDIRMPCGGLPIPVKVVTVEQANKRRQLCRGFNEAEGDIIALVDDDAHWKTDRTMINLLAPFEYQNVGLTGGPITSYVPEERQNESVITGWEVAALRIRHRRRPGMAAFYAADMSTNFTISGLTMLMRAKIARDPYFQYLFINDTWAGVKENSSDDAWITRYILFQHHFPNREYSTIEPTEWKLGMQLTDDAEVQTALLPDSRFVGQCKRWYKSGLRHRLNCLLYEPGREKMTQTAPYMARKMLGGMLNPIFTFIRFVLWCLLICWYPTIACIGGMYVLYAWIKSLMAFIDQYPYCASKIWAAVLADELYLISDLYSWATINQDAWLNRPSVDGTPESQTT
ncbi:glycosyltransferase family 2 protein [Hypoxylon fragiforme]|uniref:glycosyltransferase family 2 protein n=1 Tax=Hypoxylon fragiforme TaxID=63214 RepID=UPI0020C5B8CB|nr:glycosyltransferase family 2 protein [Hypoxylon fragiforme]KAI2604504.1 glycosyltransferase family 2 protein [Hypoxylon fragiforme]